MALSLLLLGLLAAQPSPASYCYCEYDFWDYRGYGCVASDVVVLDESDSLFIDGDHFPLDNDDTVRSVVFSKSKLSFIPPAILEKFRNLNYLVLKGVSLLALNENSLSNCERLKNMDLDGNLIAELKPGVFRQCSSLQTLRLAGNKLSSIDPKAFEGLTKLFYLDVQRNLMTALPEASLYPLPQLVTLLIGGPNFKEIYPATFTNNNLSALHIYDSPLAELHRDTLKSQTKLGRLTLYKLGLATIKPGTFRDLKSLNYLMVQVCRLTKIDSDTLAGLTNLIEADFNWNRITTIHPDAFVDNPNLKSFYFGQNYLTVLDHKLLRNNPNVRNIDVSYNQLNAVSRLFFDSHSTRLRYMTASGNRCIDKNFQTFENFTLQVAPYFKRCFRNFDALNDGTE